MAFNKIYGDTSVDLKMRFFDEIIRDDERLKAAFLAFVEEENSPPESLNTAAFKDTVLTIKSNFLASFEMADPGEPDWHCYEAPHSGYVEEWEIYQMASEQEIQDVFEEFISQATATIIAQQPDILLAQLTGMYEAIIEARVPDKHNSFDDVNEYLLSEFPDYIKMLVEKLWPASFSHQAVEKAYELFFRYWRDTHAEKLAALHYFEPLLISLAEMPNETDELLAIIKNTLVDQAFLPELVLLLHENSENESNWLQAALQLYHKSESAAKQLLTYYHENDTAAFVKIALEIFPKNPKGWAAFLEEYVSPLQDKELFVSVYLQLIYFKRQVDYYIKVKPYLDKANYSLLMEKTSDDVPFTAQLLAADGRYADIKTLIETKANHWNFDQLIAPIIKVYPDYALNNIKTMIEKTLKTARDRYVYQDVAKWLLLARQIPGLEAETSALIKNTYNHKPTLRALRDEMRKMGVVG
ncbi:MAG: hypothetical protein M0Q90_01610 [Bacteroidales bacterium]|nr:hypothetical protein [Bacteroidales bacterium]